MRIHKTLQFIINHSSSPSSPFFSIAQSHNLRRRHNIKAGRNLLLPGQTILAENLRAGSKLLEPLVQQSSPEHNLVGPQSLLGVVHVCGAVLAVVAVDRFAWAVLMKFGRVREDDGLVGG